MIKNEISRRTQKQLNNFVKQNPELKSEEHQNNLENKRLFVNRC
ncbi:LtrC [Liquorilactobacillus satsumensis]